MIYPIDCALESIFLGWLRTESESVWPASLAHATGNTIVFNVVAMLLPDAPELLAWGAFTLAGYAVLAAVLVLSGQVKWRDGR